MPISKPIGKQPRIIRVRQRRAASRTNWKRRRELQRDLEELEDRIQAHGQQFFFEPKKTWNFPADQMQGGKVMADWAWRHLKNEIERLSRFPRK